MAFLTILVTILAIFVLLVLVVTAVVIFSPVVLVVDSAGGEVRVRWLVALEYWRPLPWAEGEARLSFAGIALRLPERKPRKKKRERAARPRRAAPKQFLVRCLRDPELRRTLARQVSNLIKRIFRSADVTRWRANVSLPDPATTGMLYGFTQFGWGQRMGIEVNFSGENSFFLEIRLRPHRIVKAVMFFLTGLPYRAMFRAWRAAAPAPAR
ncbi:MAG: hypothetical protein KGL59_15580 [Acidobacteriota bacterium]|nr:hypothetical protein [Acidobacteriota bacterium]